MAMGKTQRASPGMEWDAHLGNLENRNQEIRFDGQKETSKGENLPLPSLSYGSCVLKQF